VTGGAGVGRVSVSVSVGGVVCGLGRVGFGGVVIGAPLGRNLGVVFAFFRK